MLASLSDGSIAVKTHLDIIGLVTDKAARPRRRFSQLAILLSVINREHPDEIVSEDAFHD